MISNLLQCQAEGCKSAIDSERLLRCVVEDCHEVFCLQCFEQLTPEQGKDTHEFAFVCEGMAEDDNRCLAEAIWECQEENIAYCEECFKNDHKGRRRSHSKLKLTRKKFRIESTPSEFDVKILQELKHELIVADEDSRWVQIVPENWAIFKEQSEDSYCPVISFIGSTGCGKSFLAQTLTGEEDGPRVAPVGQKGSTSANIHLYCAPGYDSTNVSFNKLLLLDCEGDSGTIPEMLQSRWLPLQKMSKKLNLNLMSMSANRTHIVKEEFPRLAYLLSDVIVFLETVDFTRIQDYLGKFNKFIESTQKGIFSADTPSLLIVQNKVDTAAVGNRLSVREATEDFMKTAFPLAKFTSKEKKKRRNEGGGLPTELSRSLSFSGLGLSKKGYAGDEEDQEPHDIQLDEDEESNDDEDNLKSSRGDDELSSSTPTVSREETGLHAFLHSSGEKRSKNSNNTTTTTTTTTNSNTSTPLTSHAAPSPPGSGVKKHKKKRTHRLSSGGDKGGPRSGKALENMKVKLQMKGEDIKDKLLEKREDIRSRFKQTWTRSDLDEEIQQQYKQQAREDTKRRKDFEASFDMISCIRIPNYRFVGSIEPNLKAFRDEVKRMVNHQHRKRQKSGTDYSERFWLDIVQEVVSSCTSLTEEGNEIRMAQIVGRVLQPHSSAGITVVTAVYAFFDLIFEMKTRDAFVAARTTAFDFLAILVATDHIKRTGTTLLKQSLENLNNHPIKIVCDKVFDDTEALITGLRPCDYQYKKLKCSQLLKDHGQVHRFPNSLRKRKGDAVFVDPNGTYEERKLKFLHQVTQLLVLFNSKAEASIHKRYELLLSLNFQQFREKSNRGVFPNCLLCLNNSNDSLLSCRHSFCGQCINDVHDNISPNAVCPLCHANFDPIRDNYQIPGHAGYRILCLDGGGTRGIIEIALLRAVMARFPGHKVNDLFDLVVGTSTGAIVAASQGLGTHTIDELYELYQTFPRQIFKKFPALRLPAFRYAYLLLVGKTIYKINDLEKVLKAHFGDADFVDAMSNPALPKVAVVATNYSSYMKGQLFGNYLRSVPKQGEEEAGITIQSEVKLYQALSASAAAPVYFAPYKIGNHQYVDGALTANNPTEIAYQEAQYLWNDRKLDYIVSLGTGKPPESQQKNTFISWTTALVNRATDSDLIHKREKAKFKKLSQDQDQPMNYFRFNPPGVALELDCYSPDDILHLVTLTENYLQKPSVKKKIEAMANLIVAKSYYLAGAPVLRVASADIVQVTLELGSRLPELGEAFVVDIFPNNKNSPNVDKTYEEVLPNNHRKVWFFARFNTKYTIHFKILINQNDPPIDISSSPFQIVIPTEEDLESRNNGKNVSSRKTKSEKLKKKDGFSHQRAQSSIDKSWSVSINNNLTASEGSKKESRRLSNNFHVKPLHREPSPSYSSFSDRERDRSRERYREERDKEKKKDKNLDKEREKYDDKSAP